ncbi:hypothetical protein EOE67_13740 [Rheinheimera riviphila]|uniref:Ketohydroxyglutarate aldolase n=1 Tax=Rheinheimera riviphila TaxID=1834037 RepID=A0A437QLN6_9GAMM|nr:hypothetical protein [Rheinheimera riviphila]RVU35434.1 hypothetical protein EOE67_13740 [Rheinheimera riviphila]
MSNEQLWIVTIDHEKSIAQVVRQLETRGLAVHSVLAEVGCVTGSAAESQLSALRAVDGVLDIAADFPVQLDTEADSGVW